MQWIGIFSHCAELLYVRTKFVSILSQFFWGISREAEHLSCKKVVSISATVVDLFQMSHLTWRKKTGWWMAKQHFAILLVHNAWMQAKKRVLGKEIFAWKIIGCCRDTINSVLRDGEGKKQSFGLGWVTVGKEFKSKWGGDLCTVNLLCHAWIIFATKRKEV